MRHHTPAGLRLGSILCLCLLASVAPASAKGPDPAERGLDVFVHAAPTAIAEDSLALDLIAYGFASVTTPRPLPNATVEAAWDPESLGPSVAAAPANVSVTTDPLGRARLEIPVPPGDARKLTLLLALRHGEHVRTRKLDLQRKPRAVVDLRVPDDHVVPGSQAPAWVTVTDARGRGPMPGAVVDFALLEGDVERSSQRVTTDASGLARASLYVPANATGTPRLTLRARLATGPTKSPIQKVVPLGLREETPAMPHLAARWREPQLKPGEVGHAEVRILDAANEPIADQPVVYWTGPKGTTPPASDDEWAKHGTRARTDGLGRLEVQAQAPRVVTSLGSSLSLVVRAEIEGQRLEVKRTVSVGQPAANASLLVESGDLVPGLTQRAWLQVDDGEQGVAGEFEVHADGLDAKVTTDAHGLGALTWTVPEDVGAKRETGPCAGGVAAAVVVRQARPIPALARHPAPFELCVSVDRERATLLRTDVQVARAGEKVRAQVIAAKRVSLGPGSVVVTGPDGFGSTAWAAAQGASASLEAEIDLSKATAGVHDVTVAVPQVGKRAITSHARVLVVPRVLPRLESKLGATKPRPGGDVEVDVVLDDGHGAPIAGAVTAVVIDKEGGGSVAGLERLDTRIALCDQAGAPRERCDELLTGAPSAEALRRSTLATGSPRALAPLSDPAAHATESLKRTFSDVLHSLEGAVFQAQTPEDLRDVRRKENGRWVFNPELMTLVTSAMSEPPTTPGGEPFGLADLIAIDPQVTFDVVARRVTRLRLFNVLAAVREFKQTEQLDSDEPVLSDPNALLRRLVREGKLTQESLLDPWGGTIQFVRTNAAPIPFITAVRGFALHAPGPDGRLGTGDDVADPFERVVRSKTPYATAMGEDEIVDAKWDMRVGEATVSGWQEMFSRLTGTALGRTGEGSGQGFGAGHGRLGGSHTTKAPQMRMGSAMVTETARWTEPVRTDAQGRARVRVRLGDYETTWRIALLARTDAGQSAVSILDVPVFLPISAKVDVGRKLTLADEVSARVVVRNRTPAPKPVTLEVSAGGALALPPDEPRVISVDVPPNAVRSVFVRLATRAEGTGTVGLTLRAPGVEGDRTTHEVSVQPPGEPRVLAAAWTPPASGGRGVLRVDVPPGYDLRGRARLVIESGVEDALLAALGSVEPSPGTSPESLADAIDIAAHVEKVAEAQGKHWLVTRSRKLAALARAHLEEHASSEGGPRERIAFARALLHPASDGGAGAPRKGRKDDAEDGCPKESDVAAAPIAFFLEAEPPPGANGPLPCFTTLTAKADSKAPLDLARAALALFDRPHRAPLATTLASELARTTGADAPSGPAFAGTRAERVIVLAALARSAHVWSRSPDVAQRVVHAMLALRDVTGGFGSSEATRDAVRALVALERRAPQPTRVTVRDGRAEHVATVAPNGAATILLGPQTTEVKIEATGGPILARLERPALRRFVAAPDATITPIAASIDWPNDARAGGTNVVHVSYKSSLGRDARVWTRLPLPPGVELAAPVKGVTVRQGVLHVRTTVSANDTIALPVRFGLAGKMLVPEAETRTTSEESAPARTPARSLVVRR